MNNHIAWKKFSKKNLLSTHYILMINLLNQDLKNYSAFFSDYKWSKDWSFASCTNDCYRTHVALVLYNIFWWTGHIPTKLVIWQIKIVEEFQNQQQKLLFYPNFLNLNLKTLYCYTVLCTTKICIQFQNWKEKFKFLI